MHWIVVTSKSKDTNEAWSGRTNISSTYIQACQTRGVVYLACVGAFSCGPAPSDGTSRGALGTLMSAEMCNIRLPGVPNEPKEDGCGVALQG